MKHNLNANEVKHVLYDKIDKRSFPEAIWQEFEQQKQELFDNYSRLIMKELHIKQPEVMNQMGLLGINIESGGYYGNLSSDCGASSSLLENTSTRRPEEMQMVKNLIEQCLVYHMSPKQAMDVLYQKEKIEPYFTKTVWRLLKEQNPEFFRKYYIRLAVIDQVLRFNDLIEKQAEMMSQLNHHPNEVAEMRSFKYAVAEATPITEVEIDRHKLGVFGLQFQAPPTPL
ncbi:putative angiotensin-converting enzyme 2 [Helianthus annuus]|uniref:Angiotensin-converting enzyme 2 n=1 Tax=Helianthus annuus TaxID=4232 RepID=A0A9K3H5S4_HELAN|nr:putative angiotensin-converting enzyme 2 [Helianthus annuus]KAJ0839863.1 putative angiotensin-converting enzyme 2 [Helianthus annuus]